MADQGDAAEQLLGLAREDLAAAKALKEAEGVSTSKSGFNAQQAVEKALKAVLAARLLYASPRDLRRPRCARPLNLRRTRGRFSYERCGGRSARPQPKAIAKRPRVIGTLGHLGVEAQLVEHFHGKPARADCLFLRIPAWQRKSPRHGTVEADDPVELPQARKSEMVPSNGTTAIWKSRSAKSAGTRHRTWWTR